MPSVESEARDSARAYRAENINATGADVERDFDDCKKQFGFREADREKYYAVFCNEFQRSDR